MCGRAIADRVVTKEYILHLQESLQEVYTLYLRSSLQQEKRQSSEQITNLEEKIAHLQNLLEVWNLRIRVRSWIHNGVLML
ncbi:hypothetical protein AAMO2058_001143700 [Amorphochlora amoebiformis]